MARRDQEQNWKGIPHCRIRSDVTSSIAWRILSVTAKALYLDLRAKLRANNNGNVNAAMSEMKHLGWRSKTTLAKALYELLALGFIVRTRAGGVSRGSKVCSLYGFTDLDIEQNDRLAIVRRRPSFEYRDFKSITEAQIALKEGVDKLHAESLLRQQPTRAAKKNDGPVSGLVRAVSGPDSGLVGCLSSPYSGLVNGVGNVH